jgi:hypothetical protein
MIHEFPLLAASKFRRGTTATGKPVAVRPLQLFAAA